MFRMFIDEVGTHHVHKTWEDNNQFLSLTGAIIKIDHADGDLTKNMNWIKHKVFNHDQQNPIIFHRHDIVNKRGAFSVLRDETKLDLFNRSIMRLLKSTEYKVITALIDKSWMVGQRHWKNDHPYHYLMEILVEKYVQFLERHNETGDIMPESRKDQDKSLQDAYNKIREKGTQYRSTDQIKSMLRGQKLKFRSKKDNVSALQLCDLIAHPSHIYTRSIMRHKVNLGPFAKDVVDILNNYKYDRSKTGKIIGYGIKHLPV